MVSVVVVATTEVTLNRVAFMGGYTAVVRSLFFDTAAQVVLKRVSLLSGYAAVSQGFFFGIASFSREARVLSYSSSELAEELSCSSSHSDRSQNVLLPDVIFSGKGLIVMLGLDV